MLALYWLLVLVSLFGISFAQNIQLNATSKRFVDPQGRVRIFHGVNAVYKIPPWVPSFGDFDAQNSLGPQDVSQLQQWGFTSVRLGTMWPGVMPSKGVFNMTYLQQIEQIVNALGEAGIYSIIDMHQDIISRYYCGEGMPDWLVSHDGQFRFPSPISNPNMTFESNGYPTLSDCLKVQFAGYYLTDQVSVQFQELYTNSHNTTDYLRAHWNATASFFAKNPYVLGYELINEPWAGDYLADLELLKPGVTDKRYLTPLYTLLHETIRAVDDSHIIFFEPMVMDEGLSGFTQGPGGPAYNDRQAYSFHIYCGIPVDSPNPRLLGLCNATDLAISELRRLDMERMGVGGFLTEFGALNGTVTDIDSLHLITDVSDSLLWSWNYWQYKFFQDLTTSGDAESFYYFDGTLDVAKVKALSRTYAPAIAGEPLYAVFQPNSAVFKLVFSVNLAITAPTLIFLNEQYYYPNGYTVTIQPTGAASYTQTSTNWLNVVAETKTNGLVITVVVAPK